MNLINKIIALILFSFATYMGALLTGIPIAVLFDPISIIIVAITPYFLIASSTNSYTFYNNSESLKKYGDLAYSFGWIGFVIGIIYMLTTISSPLPSSEIIIVSLSGSIAIAIIPLFYGIIIKYFFINLFNQAKK